MACEEATFSRQHSTVSENQHQHQHQRPFTAEGAEESKTLPLSHGKPGQANADEQERIKQRAEALVRRIGETCDELERLAEENPGLVGRVTRGAEEQKDAYLR